MQEYFCYKCEKEFISQNEFQYHVHEYKVSVIYSDFCYEAILKPFESFKVFKNGLKIPSIWDKKYIYVRNSDPTDAFAIKELTLKLRDKLRDMKCYSLLVSEYW